jgi:hypothetical protein
MIASYVTASAPPISNTPVTSSRRIERGEQIRDHVLDCDRLRARADPARRDHHRQALDERADHLERQAARADDDRRPQLDRRHAGLRQ